jgi:hypothetical protein
MRSSLVVQPLAVQGRQLEERPEPAAKVCDTPVSGAPAALHDTRQDPTTVCYSAALPEPSELRARNSCCRVRNSG